MTRSTAVCAAIIVAYNNQETIGACLSSVFEKAGVPVAAVVVDNSPGEETFEALTLLKDIHPGWALTLIRRPDNIGFAAGCNLGARDRTEEYLFFLNPDTALREESLARLISFLEKHPEAGTVGPQLLDEGGRVVHTCRNFPTPWGIFCDAAGLDAVLGAYKLTRFSHAETRPVDQIMGAAMLFRRADFERHRGFDERFFIYFEEVDLCKRLSDAGAGVWFFPEAQVVHAGGVSCEAQPTVHRMLGVLRRSRSQYFAKHFGIWPQFLIQGITLAEALGKIAALALLSLLRPARAPYYKAKMRGFWQLFKEWRQTPAAR